MCGIAGLLLNDAEARPEPARLRAMVDSLAHRGPDDAGFHHDANVAIGMRRLAIVDPIGGHQPVTNEDGTVQVVYNGECYNYRELRAELTTAGHRFTSNTDTEVIAHGYEAWGIEGLARRLNGIFAFCVWDARTRTAFLVRDRLGVKPLYYITRPSGLAFSSEIRSLIESGWCVPRLDHETVWQYLLYQFAPTNRTPLAGVVRLPPACVLEWRAESAPRIAAYWHLPVGPPGPPRSLDAAAEEVRALFEDTVSRQLIGDVPMGCFLSGGLDSSGVAAVMADRTSEPLLTYSIGFPTSRDYDETRHALRVARHLGTRHTAVAFDEGVLVDRVDAYLRDIDEPIGDAAMFPTWLLAETAARDVKVVLTGEGADEVFGGYAYYRALSAAPPPPASLQSGDPVPGPPSHASGFPFVMQAASIWMMLPLDARPSLATFQSVLARPAQPAATDAPDATRLQRALAADLRVWLAHDLLTKLDKATMAHGLEARVPMLDHRLVELAAALPDELKVSADVGKVVLRRALRPLVPAATHDRAKQGFGVPLDVWFRGPLRDLVHDLFSRSLLVRDGVLTRESLRTLLDAHTAGRQPLGRAIWTLLNLDVWWRRTCERILAATDAPAITGLGAVSRAPTVDIVIPVRGSLNLTRDCIQSIRRWTSRPFRAILVDDSGDPDHQARLARTAGDDDRFQILTNDRNVGYVQSCIRGMSRSTAHYIVLLNSDTVVTPTWLERLVRCAESDPRIAIVNPITNESGNTSVRMAPGLNVLTMARRVAALSKQRYPDITTAVGMCMLVRRSALEQFGGFDPIFEGAYCEESDLCMRLTEAGLRVVAADDAFVYHKGNGSYTDATKQALYERNRRIFDERWGVAYERDWSAYARRDPLQYLRDGLLTGTARLDEGPELGSAINLGWARLNPRHALGAVAEGARTSAAATMLADLAPAWTRPHVAEWTVRRIRQPATRFDERAVVLPTRAYARMLPAPEPGALRITFLVSSFPLCGGIVSIAQLARGLIAAGHDVKIATEAHDVHPELLNLWTQPLIYRDRRHLVDAFPESDVVVATYWTTAYQYLPELRRRYRFASAYFIQDYEAWFYDEGDRTSRRAVTDSYGFAEHHIVKSKWLADLVDPHGPKCEIVPLGLDLGVFYPRSGERRQRVRVVSGATSDPGAPRRGFAQTVEIFRQLHGARPDVDLVFFGTSPERMPALPFPYTNAGRLVDQNDVAALLSSADVLLDASLWQGFGRPGLEAMACGAVPVLTRNGGLHEYAVDGENAVLIDPIATADSARAIRDLLDDPARLARLRGRGPSTAARFSHELEATRHAELYQRWVKDLIRRGSNGLPNTGFAIA